MLNQNLLLAGDDAYNLTRSLRFRSSASAYLNRTFSTGNRLLFTFSAWVKRGSLTGNQNIFGPYTNSTGTGTYGVLRFVDGTLEAFDYTNGTINWYLVTTQVFRDPSAWYHIVMAYDSAQATSSNRVKLYVNGVQVTAFSYAAYPSLSYQGQWNDGLVNYIGTTPVASQYFDGYLTEVNFIDGQALTPSSFGQTNSATGVWQPAKYTGTYGTNGFYLPFTNTTSTSTLGNDFSGNSNTWTVNNISLTSGSTYDSMTDVPTLTSVTTANYCVLNPLVASVNSTTLNNGNLQFVSPSSGSQGLTTATIGVSSGKWYWEQTTTSDASSAGQFAGIISSTSAITGYVGSTSQGWGYYNNGNKYNNSSASSYGASWGVNDVIGVALDMDAGTITFYKNNTSQGTAFTGLSGTMFPAISDGGTGSITVEANFGQRPFAYTPPTGFVALNTFNLPTPTIGATASSQASKYMNIVLYTGDNSSSPRSITGFGFSPDFVWVKARSNTIDHNLWNSVMGSGASQGLHSNTTTAAGDGGNFAIYGYVSSLDSDGFTVTKGSDATYGNFWHNYTSTTYVAWAWDANGTGSTNTAGSITSTVSANTTAGFSIATYTGTGANATVGHGLGVAPSMVIVKRRDAGSSPWNVWHTSLTSGTYFLVLNSTAAQASGATRFTALPTSTVINIGTDGDVNANTGTYVAYCFAQVAGYSAFGSYTGNLSTDGPFVFTGFRPRFVMIKCSSSDQGGNAVWGMFDTARNTYNVANNRLYADGSAAESTTPWLDINSNGFKIRDTTSSLNGSSATYIYMALAENPFKYSLAR